ncbi:2-keto-3-deoxy-phosphogluconate aldolase [Cellulophaga algicola DSM 14237]|uniref:2-keto-3-deoxy-phosphogluconate aldolase n=1 Tax=Cellulophaga algicola (strain DSM 14237 / IC166 / ACAM 630) TaxID=688270 RepID=E6XA72_CELAD|nr:bifunctional 4-hydroxy-2-oxoglutarate aldolase/2-dehydro-3-deoxy-phosphogluconate aldolase [Cellulophaga algicola]ADV47762.1 2-keto-3-deoxy-phosphogluconate aldolase [Cellulophaga algicola DSM 14237]
MTSKTSFSWDAYNKAPIVGIIRGESIDIVREIAKSYIAAELFTIEITMNTKDADKIITMLRSEFPNLNVGAGTVCNINDYEKAIEAGSQFIVTPIIDEVVIKKAVSDNIPIFPGGYSPTEIYKAWDLGASVVKIFPATLLGPTYVKDVLAPLNKIKLLPTGGVNKDNIKSFFAAGATGVGMGSSLLNKQLIKERNFDGLTEYFKNIKSEIQEYIK